MMHKKVIALTTQALNAIPMQIYMGINIALINVLFNETIFGFEHKTSVITRILFCLPALALIIEYTSAGSGQRWLFCLVFTELCLLAAQTAVLFHLCFPAPAFDPVIDIPYCLFSFIVLPFLLVRMAGAIRKEISLKM